MEIGTAKKQSLTFSHFLRWFKIIIGRSYYHRLQPIGSRFIPGEISGYFNDLSNKVSWNGPCDVDGMPLVELLDGRRIYFPTTIIQKGLGHWDVYLINGSIDQRSEFLKVCSWVMENQDSLGGWPTKEAMGLGESFNYSAMPQGEAISLLVRAWTMTGNLAYIGAAKTALELMLKPVQDGGTSFYTEDFLFFEEYPSLHKNTVLNGWVFALFGLYDYCLATKEAKYQEIFLLAVNTLATFIKQNDAYFWSYYDENKAIASPFYHSLHISQLEALYLITNNDELGRYLTKFKKYDSSKICRFISIVAKGVQKLRSPGHSVVKC